MKPLEPSKAYRLLYPSVPAVLSCAQGGRVYAMPVISCTFLSNEPPLVGISSSPEHATHRAVLKAKRFSLSWLDASFARQVELLGTIRSTGTDKLAAAGMVHRPGEALGTPLPTEAAAALECVLVSRRRFGDHELLVGRVEEALATPDFADYWRFKEYAPILYAGSPSGKFSVYGVARGARGGRR